MRQDHDDGTLGRLEALMELCRRCRASDLHLSPGRPPYLRLDGELRPVRDAEPLPAEETLRVAEVLMSPRQRRTFEDQRAMDLAWSTQDGTRFRVNVYRQQRGVSVAMRRLEDRLMELADWNLPETLGDLAAFRDGLVLVTGPTGSGKSTTLATLIHRLGRERACHVITIEDPVEYLHAGERALVHQRELHTDVASFSDAVRSALREDPDVLLVGEMRDLETMRAAIVAAETGHLVFSTLHTGDAVGAVERLVAMFPAEEQDSLRHQVSMVLRAVVAQKLLPAAGGPGRVPALEVLQVTAAVSNLIRTRRSEQIYSVMESGHGHGMQTMEQDLARLTARGEVAPVEARRAARNVEVFEEWLHAARSGAIREAGPW